MGTGIAAGGVVDGVRRAAAGGAGGIAGGATGAAGATGALTGGPAKRLEGGFVESRMEVAEIAEEVTATGKG